HEEISDSFAPRDVQTSPRLFQNILRKCNSELFDDVNETTSASVQPKFEVFYLAGFSEEKSLQFTMHADNHKTNQNVS
ncbi:hypothetical protein, partial [Enterococcus faecium]